MDALAAQVKSALHERLPHLAEYVVAPSEAPVVLRVPHPAIPCGLVVRAEAGDVSVGFRQWHTHGDLLGGGLPAAQIDAVLDLVGQILRSEVLLAVSHVDGAFVDAWVTDDPAKEGRFAQSNGTLRVGTWAELAA